MSSLTIKIPIIGPKGVGKSVFANAITDLGNEVVLDYKPTIGVRIMTKELELTKELREKKNITSTKVKAIDFEFWDMSGNRT